MSLNQLIESLREEFAVKDLDTLVQNFVSDARKSLEKDSPRAMPMIPSFVTKIPDGTENGVYLAADLGGSNFRVCSVKLNGNKTHDIRQMKWKVPDEIMRGTGESFWNFLADRTQEFMLTLDLGADAAAKERVLLGFCFSFPVQQTALNRGTLIRWTKGYDVKEAVGQDICIEFQKALDARNLPVEVAALVNDTVGCLLARSYETGKDSQTMVGSILGTGTNAAYSEKVSQIKKLDSYAHCSVNSKIMVINTEWGSFDNDLNFLPNTEIDKAINLDTPNPNFHMFEKRVSGMFLGEITRRIIERSVKRGELFQTSKESIPENANLYKPWSTDTSFLSLIAADATPDFEVVNQELWKIGICQATQEEMKAVKEICHIVAVRSARLVAGIIAGLLTMTSAFDKFEIVDIGMDGSVIEFYPHYEELLRDAWRSIAAVGDKEKRITIGISKDGSGIGAALCAAMSKN